MRSRMTLALALAAGLAASALSAAELTERYDKTYPFAGKGSFSLTNVNGYVAVHAWDRAEVRIQAVKKAKSHDSEEAARALKDLVIAVKATPGRLEVETKGPGQSHSVLGWLAGSNVDTDVAYDIQVPKDIQLKIETVNGHIEVAGVRGTIDLETTNGGVDISAAEGHLEASTTNGGIRAQLLAVSGPLDLSTTNGAISVELPAALKASLDAETTNGSIHTDFPITMQGTLTRSEMKGAINGGGPPLHLRTTNGSIRVNKGAQ